MWVPDLTKVHLDHLLSKAMPRGAESLRSTWGFYILCTWDRRSGGSEVYAEVSYKQLGPEIRGVGVGEGRSPSPKNPTARHLGAP